MTAAPYETVRTLARHLADFAGLEPEAVIRGDMLRAEMQMRIRDGIRARGQRHGSLNEPRTWMNFVPSAEALLRRDPAILSRIAAGYVPPMRHLSRAVS